MKDKNTTKENEVKSFIRNLIHPIHYASEGIIGYKTLDKLDENSRKFDDTLESIPTGFRDLDSVIMGLHRSELIFLAGRPGIGKSSLALNIARNIVSNRKKTVAFFSLEMTKEQIVSRLLSSEALVEKAKLNTGELSDEEWVRIKSAGDMFSESDIVIDDTPGITVSEIRSKLKRLRNIDFVVVDYLQLVMCDRKVDNRIQEVSEIIKSLKMLAKEFNIPVFCVSQLNRAPEERDDHRPMISDLEKSGSIIYDSDIILLLYREGYYTNRNDTQIDNNSGECIFAKNNHGETGTVMLKWQGEFGRFTTKE